MPLHEFECHLTPAGRRSRVLMDGEEVPGLRAVTVRTAVDELTTVTLEFVNNNVKVFTGVVAEVDD